MSTLAQQSLTRCDDCGEKRPLAWWGHYIRICAECRKSRVAAVRVAYGSADHAR